MEDSVEEVRYPWNNFLEFLSGGYFLELAAVHLVLGFIAVFFLTISTLRQRQFPIRFRCSLLYFTLTVFGNPAFDIGGLRINELFGVFAVLLISYKCTTPALNRASAAALLLSGVFMGGLVHTLIAAVIYPTLTAEAGMLALKIVLNVKVAVLALNMLIVGDVFRRGRGYPLAIKLCVRAGTVGLIVYLVQVLLLSSRAAVPYGTYLDAGFTGIPSFGSVATERGHFGKLMAPYYAFFLAALVMWGWRWRFALLALVTLMNFSASSQAYFAVFLSMTLIAFRRSIRGWGSASVVLFGLIGMTIVVTLYQEAFLAVASKIYEIAILGDEGSGGGRSLSTFLAYLSSYPLGMGYSGSTLRTAPGLPDINSGYYAFFAQYSLLSIPIISSFAWILWTLLRQRSLMRSVRPEPDRFHLAMTLGALLAPVIFITDILWFVPLIWLPFELLLRYPCNRRVLNVRLQMAAGSAASHRHRRNAPRLGFFANS